MARRDLSFTIALSSSLLAHGVLGLMIVEAYAEREAYRLASFDRPMWINLNGEVLLPLGLWNPPPESSALAELAADPAARIEEPPAPPLLARAQPPPPPPPAPEFRPPMGDDLGGGQAIGRVEGDAPQQARQNDQDQPALTRDAPGSVEPSLPSPASPASPALDPSRPVPAARPTPPTPPEPADPTDTPSGGAEGFLRNATGRTTPEREHPDATAQDPSRPAPRLGAEQTPAIPDAPRIRRPPPATPAEPPPVLPPDTALPPVADGTAVTPRPEAAKPDQTTRDTPGQAPDAPPPLTPPPASPPPVTADTPASPSDDRPVAERDQPQSPATSPPRTASAHDATPSSPASPPTPQGAGLPPPIRQTTAAQPEPPSRLPDPVPQPTAPDATPPAVAQGTDSPAARADGEPATDPNDRRDDALLPPPAPGAAAPNARPASRPDDPSPETLRPPDSPSTPVEASAASTPSTPSTPSVAVPAGEPGTRSDRESDPFSRVGSIAFTPGRVDARLGRQVRWVRPRLTMAGQLDAVSSRSSAVSMAVTIDNTGRVTNVRVVESSGFPDTIDLPVLRAVYAWWFEPLKNAAGEPQPDVLLIRVVIRN